MIGSNLIQSVVRRFNNLLDTASSATGAGMVGFLYATAYAGNTVGAWLKGLAAAGGSSFIGWIQTGTGATKRTLQDKLRDHVSPLDFGVVADGVTDNTTALATLVTYLNTFTGTATPPRVHFPAGVYAYATSPNWAVSWLHLDFAPGVIFKHTGAGIAMDFDGGASGSGVTQMRVTGHPLIGGNASTTSAVRTRAVHRSHFELRVRNASAQGLLINFAVCNVYHVKCTPIGEPAFSPVPVTGILMDQRAAGEMTSACTFINPIMEGVSGYGLNLANAVQNTIICGTSEANGGGIFVSGTSTKNTVINLDMEANSSADVFCQGLYNKFIQCLSTTTSTFAGQTNTVDGGTYNNVVQSGIDNRYYDVGYSANAGTFSLAGSGTVKRGVRNLTSNTLDTDLAANPQGLIYTAGPTGLNHVRGSADQLVSGSANDTVDYKYGAAQHQFWVNNIKNMSLGSGTWGVLGATPVAQSTGWGTPTGAAKLANFPAATATLPQTAAQLAQLIIDIKATGILGT